jgi:hypothetical protein
MEKTLMVCIVIYLSISHSLAQRIPPLNPKKLGIGPTKGWRCYPLRYDSKLGINYGIHKNSVGVKLQHLHSWIGGIPFMLHTDMEARIGNQKNSYLNLALTRLDVASIGKFSVAANLGYKRLSYGNINVNNQFYTGLSLFKNYYGITLAYARQYQRLENFNQNDNGIMMRWYHEFFDHFEVEASGIYWFDQFQYAIQLNENLFQSGFVIGVGYEKIGIWNEVDVSIMYQY